MRQSPCHDLIFDVMKTLAPMIVVERLADRYRERKKSVEQPRAHIRSIRS